MKFMAALLRDPRGRNLCELARTPVRRPEAHLSRSVYAVDAAMSFGGLATENQTGRKEHRSDRESTALASHSLRQPLSNCHTYRTRKYKMRAVVSNRIVARWLHQ